MGAGFDGVDDGHQNRYGPAIHPAINIARIGDSATEYFIGPEVTEPAPEKPGTYRDSANALKRQAARFRIYGYNADGEVGARADGRRRGHRMDRASREPEGAVVQFQAALDIPEAAAMSVPLRNAELSRSRCARDRPGPRSIKGKSTSGGAAHQFDTGKFKTHDRRSRRDPHRRGGASLVLGGTGESASPSGAPVFKPKDPNSFNNADDW